MADDEVKSYFQLEFGTNKSGATELKLKGPQIPDSETSPVIIFHKENGRFVFELGADVHEVDVKELSDDLKAYFGGVKRADGRSGPLPIQMPSRNRLIRADGSFKGFADFKRDTMAGLITTNVRRKDFKTPIIPEPLYWELVWFYRTHDKWGNPLFL